MITDLLREQVRERARNRCEYCLSHQDYVMGRLQIDHITPMTEGGTDDPANLCLACELCNQYKWAKINGVDPVTGIQTRLFNPRIDLWGEHFSWSEGGTEIQGTTDIGRVTVNVLRLNNSLAVTVRNNWVRAGWHPPTMDA